MALVRVTERLGLKVVSVFSTFASPFPLQLVSPGVNHAHAVHKKTFSEPQAFTQCEETKKVYLCLLS